MLNNKTKKIILLVSGSFFILFGLFAMFFSVYNGTPEWILWACYIGMIIIGIGILIKDGELIASQLNILTIPLLLWTFDFIYTLFTGRNILGMAEYFFDRVDLVPKVISLEHLFLLPIGFFALYLIGLKERDSWKISYIQLTAVFLIMKLFRITDSNVNCISYPCWNFPIFQPYFIEWFLIIFTAVALTSFMINKLFLTKTTNPHYQLLEQG
ncbi:MAG: hypothetical protein WC533_00440 [Candidatus Pacearchaeota archaeon]